MLPPLVITNFTLTAKKADDRVLAPAVSRLDKRVLYVTYDITDKLHAGDNVIAIWHGPGWAGFSSFSKHFAACSFRRTL